MSEKNTLPGKNETPRAAYDKLKPERIQRFLTHGGGWRHEGKRLVRRYRFTSFGAATAFARFLAELASETGRSPTVEIRGGDLRLSLGESDGITEADLRLADAIDRAGGLMPEP